MHACSFSLFEMGSKKLLEMSNWRELEASVWYLLLFKQFSFSKNQIKNEILNRKNKNNKIKFLFVINSLPKYMNWNRDDLQKIIEKTLPDSIWITEEKLRITYTFT